MASRGKKSERELAMEALRRLTRVRSDPNDLWDLIEATFGDFAADATIALSLGAAIEQALEIAISTHFVLDADGCNRMFEDDEMAAISNFAAKIKLAYALGIYQKHIRDELNLIKAIRNAFAHAKADLGFEEERISAACKCLWIPTRWYYGTPVHLAEKRGKTHTARTRYITSIRMLFLYLESSDVVPKKFATSAHYSFLAWIEPSPDTPA